jgi:hypothetical protein
MVDALRPRILRRHALNFVDLHGGHADAWLGAEDLVHRHRAFLGDRAYLVAVNLLADHGSAMVADQPARSPR